MTGAIKRALEAAKAKGEKQFFADVPCRRAGHNAHRFTASGQCVECDRLRYRANAEKRVDQMRAWRDKNPEVQKAANKRWKEANRDACRTHSFMRDKRKANGPGFTAKQADAVFEAQGRKCANCLKKINAYHADHVVPLALGGLHAIENIQALCASCNHRKHMKDPIKWANENGRLL